ncbi:NADPH:quinone reductase [Terrabacter sp. Root85]|uniref:NADP-dependent oxidoreductase n=1 Tax=Terrabacter sp. Root85 TaxID=1736603 RepID=UPI0006F51A46|nr:NADP-dependent oxidoreductase [Terrabacter sp. Root85]KRC89258.1 NADPH:quinone reductase [Terrabacter sp. Root85]
MKAIVIDRFGGPEELHEAQRPDPQPAPGQVRVRVEAVGVNPADGKARSGLMASPDTTFPLVPGLEAAGVVDALGDGVTDVAVGDRVVGFAEGGAYAELAVLSTYAVMPDALDATVAVSLPVAGETSRRVLRFLGVQPGETLLVHGASGVVGEVATQLAVAGGATVIGTASAANQERVAALGATPTTYGDGWLDRVRALAPNGVDAVLDASGAGVLDQSVELLGSPDRLVTIADPAAFTTGITFSGTSQRSAQELADLVAQRASGAVTTTISRVLPLAEAAAAQALSDSGRAGGKLVLVP